MTDRTDAADPHDDAQGSGDTSTRDPPRRPPVFNPKGIESNIFLTAAAAVVPLVIVGVAGLKTILGARRGRR